uniref:Uncharacterized protein n=1 Tax=Oryza barthii TaxID=65489 RepID=A0A0D3FJX6_9ORYZ
MPVVLRADDGGEGSTFALYFLICCHVRARLLLPCVGASEELAVAGQCVDGASMGAAAGAAGEELVVVGQCIDCAGVGAAVPLLMSAMHARWSGNVSCRDCCCCSGRAWPGIAPL